MSYNAKITGAIDVVNIDEFIEKMIAAGYFHESMRIARKRYNASVIGLAGITVAKDNSRMTLEFDSLENWDEDRFFELLRTMLPFTAAGYINGTGEDNEMWNYTFEREKHEWVERTGIIEYINPTVVIRPEDKANEPA